jgi:hypothetical protein
MSWENIPDPQLRKRARMRELERLSRERDPGCGLRLGDVALERIWDAEHSGFAAWRPKAVVRNTGKAGVKEAPSAGEMTA